uniref:Uncharacterized protein n=1 Tax=Knipowitschia caucasica TaxID=637954 RepID=A0AAV2MM42_KNICA
MTVSEQDLSCPICFQRSSAPVLHPQLLQRVFEDLVGRDALKELSNLQEKDSDAHKNHIFKPIDEVTPGFRNQLQDVLQRLAEQLQDVNKSKMEFSAAVTHVEAQARLTERQIQDQFKRLHQFLEEEEQSRISALREEEQQKRRSL